MSFEVCIPVPRPLPGGPGVACKELPAARVACLTFRGPYDTIWNAHVELLAWVGEHGYTVSGSAARDRPRRRGPTRRPAGMGDGASVPCPASA